MEGHPEGQPPMTYAVSVVRDQAFFVTSQNRKMNDGSRVSSTPFIPAPYTAVFCPTHEGMNGTSVAARSCSLPNAASRVEESSVDCSCDTSLLASGLL